MAIVPGVLVPDTRPALVPGVGPFRFMEFILCDRPDVGGTFAWLPGVAVAFRGGGVRGSEEGGVGRDALRRCRLLIGNLVLWSRFSKSAHDALRLVV